MPCLEDEGLDVAISHSQSVMEQRFVFGVMHIQTWRGFEASGATPNAVIETHPVSSNVGIFIWNEHQFVRAK
jgi:hypothetical protein